MDTFNHLGRKFCALLSVAFLFSHVARGDSLYLGGINRLATGTNLGGGHYGLDISGNITASSASAGLTGITVPTYADFIGANKAGVLTGLLLGSQTMANSLAVTIASDQAAIPVTGSITASNPSVSSTGAAVPASATMIGGSDGTNLKALKVSTAGVVSVDGSAVTQPVSAASLPLPTGAATAAKQPALGTAGSASADVITVQGIASMTALKVDGSATTQPVSGTVTANQGGTWNITNISGTVSLPTGASTSALQTTGNTSLSSIDGKLGSLGQKAMSGSAPVVLASDQSAVPTKAAVNANGSGSAAASTVSTVITLTAPANAVGFILQNLDTSTANIRWAVGRTASTTLGQQLQPGRDTGFIPVGANVSLVAESGTQNYDVQWVSQ